MKLNGTNPNKFLWSVVDLVLEESDKKEHTLDKFFDERTQIPRLDDNESEIIQFILSQPKEKQKEYGDLFYRLNIYSQAISNGEKELTDYPYLWRKYH